MWAAHDELNRQVVHQRQCRPKRGARYSVEDGVKKHLNWGWTQLQPVSRDASLFERRRPDILQ